MSNNGENPKQWPSLWEESHDMMILSTSMFFLGKMRKLEREGKMVEGSAEAIQSTPITADDIVKAIDANHDVIDALEGAADFGPKKNMPRVDLHAQMLHASMRQSMATLVNSPTWRLLSYCDEHAEEGLVYGIAVDDVKQRVMVPFRGTESAKDWETNLNAKFCWNPNPLYGNDTIVIDGKKMKQPKTVVMHRGFRDYMFDEDEVSYEADTGTESPKKKNTKFDTILEKVAKVMQESDRSGYDLYTTGFSLGGALTTVFSLYAAASPDPRIPKPITCYSFASPKVGAFDFRKAFQSMELSGKLRCVRVANENDPIKEYPEGRMCLSTFLGGACLCQRMYYRHVGMTLFLHQSEEPGFSFEYYPRSKNRLRHCWDDTVYDRQICRTCCINGCRTLWGKDEASNYRKYHGYPEYLHRLEGNRDELRKYTLNDLYDKAGETEATCLWCPLLCGQTTPSNGELIMHYY